jgi:transcription antitermination factor NusG
MGRCLPFLLLSVPGLLAAQEAAIAPGQRVRIDAPTFRGVAQVSEVRADTLDLLVANRPGPVLIPIAEIQRLEVRHQN